MNYYLCRKNRNGLFRRKISLMQVLQAIRTGPRFTGSLTWIEDEDGVYQWPPITDSCINWKKNVNGNYVAPK